MSSFPVNSAIAATQLTEFIASPSEPIELDHPFVDLPRDLCSDVPPWKPAYIYGKLKSCWIVSTVGGRSVRTSMPRVEQARQRAEKLAAKLRELGVDPNCL